MNEYNLALIVEKNDTLITINFSLDAKSEESAIWAAKNIISRTSLKFVKIEYVETILKKEDVTEIEADAGEISLDK